MRSRKTRLLAACRTLSIEDARVLLAYHDCLLFLLTYPQTPAWRDRLGGQPEAERRSFRSLCPLLAMIPELGRWPAADRRKAIAVMRAKGMASERNYFVLLRRHRRLCEALVELASPEEP